MNYRYHLLKYAGPASRWTCPQCGRKHCFAPYVDKDNRPAGEEYGRCDHESSCGYVKYPPSETDWRESYAEYRNRITRKAKPIQAKPVSHPEQSDGSVNTLPRDIVIRTVRSKPVSDFLLFLSTLFDTDTILRLVGEYLLGVTKDSDVIFYQIDIKGRIRGGKIMKYNRETGHRIKDPAAKNPVGWVHVPMLRKGLLPEGWTMTQCLFGEHLLAQYPDKVVCLVEAEKTAVICAAMMPEFIWLATGGKSGFNDRVEVLNGRKVIAFPDVDAYDQWCEKAAERPYLDITVSDYLQQNATEDELNSGADIADVLIRWQKENDLPPVSDVSSVSHTIQPIQQIQENPIMAEIRKYISPEYWTEVAALIEEFDLELVSVTRIESEQ